jgi:hypothetical protein
MEDSAGPEFIFNTLTIEGPQEPLHESLGAASGAGFLDWRPEWYGVYEGIYFNLLRAGIPTVQAGDKLARKFRDIACWTHERERVASELDPHRQALDLNALFPIPKARAAQGIRRGRAGVDVEELGVRWPIRKVKFAMEQWRLGRTGLKPVAVFRFLSEDWSPWSAFARMRARWPGLRFMLSPEYL